VQRYNVGVHEEKIGAARCEAAAHALIAGLPADAPVGFAILDARLETVLASPAIAVLPAGLEKPAEQAFATGRGATLEFEAPGRQGAVRRWQAWLGRMDVEGTPFVGVLLADVTARTRTVEALRESESQLAAAQSIARMGWWLWTFDPPEVLFSTELAQVMGLEMTNTRAGSVEQFFALAQPEERPRMEAEIAAAVAERRPMALQLSARRADGALRRFDVRGAPVLDEAGSVTGMKGFTQDVTEREGARARQRAVAELGRLGLGDEPTDELLRCTAALVGEALTVEADVHEGADAPPPGGAFEAVAVNTPRRRFGLLTVRTAPNRRPGDEEMTFLRAIAHVLGEAIGRRETAAEIADLTASRGRLVAQAIDAEGRARRSISEHLHDGPLQDLLAAGHDLYGLGESPEATAARDRLREIVRDLREAMVALHPTVLQYGGLGAAVRAVAEQQARAGGFHVAVSVDERAAGTHDELMLSLARQVLANVARHAAATDVSVHLGADSEALRLEVIDDGRDLPEGGAPGGPDGGQIGLAATAERVAAVGGSFEAGPHSNGGTRVCIVLPVHE
jgi:signal transduction histidine kinase